MTYRTETKAIKLLQDRASETQARHDDLASALADVKERLASIDGVDAVLASPDYLEARQRALAAGPRTPLSLTPLDAIFAEANARYPERVGLADILDAEDSAAIDARIGAHVADFNRRYGLDGWDYAIAGGCGLFAAMLDLLCVKPPPKPSTTAWETPVDGIFNRAVQQAFNAILPQDVSAALSKGFPIGAPDTSVTSDLIGGMGGGMNPTNHRLRSLAHDPLFGFIFGVWDMLHGTCTTVVDGGIVSIPTTKGPTDGSIFQLLGRMLGHLASDVNAPSAGGNRGMGLPAPFMGLLRMFDGIAVGDSTFGKQIEWMFVNGYDFRQFVVTSVPMAIMEVLLRAFYVAKQTKLYGAPLGETLMDTMPGHLNPRFRMMLAMAYGTSSAVNAGKMYVTGNILNANYASWMGLAWNGFHALKWGLLDRHLKLWDEIEAKEIAELECLVERIDVLAVRAETLPV